VEPQEPASTEAPTEPTDDLHSAEDWARLRDVLFGAERRRIDELAERIEEVGSAEELSKQLPHAIAESVRTDDRLANALAPSIDDAIQRSVQRDPGRIAEAIYPTLGPAIRKAIAQTMAGLVESINRAIEHSVSIEGLRWRFESWRTGVPYAQVVIRHALVYRVEQVFLIHGETGLLAAHAAAPDLETQDADLVSGMLTAIRDFARDSFDAATDADLDTFTIGDLTVFAQAGPRAVLAGVVRGQAPPEIRERLEETLEAVHLRFGSALRDFDGDPAPFDDAVPLLEECLHTEVATGRRAGKRGAIWTAWSLAIAVLLVVAVLVLRSGGHWRAVQRALEAEPGLVLLEADRQWGRWTFRGLRDPDARDPMLLLADWDVDTARVETAWETYLSLDPTMVVRRALRLLDAPSSVSVEVVGDTVVASGAADADWVPTAAHELEALPLVAHFDARGLEVRFPAELERARTDVDGRRVLFAVGSAALSAEGLAEVRAVAEAWPAIDTAAAAVGWSAEMLVVGRTDTTGTAETNERLSDLRAAEVARVLTVLGVPRPVLIVEGRGNQDPLAGDDAESNAQANRSVSFQVRLSPYRALGEVSR
jgi:OOP family OmpA-OmpF porin